MNTTSIRQLCIDLPAFGIMNECRWLETDHVTVCGHAGGPYQLHITCDDIELQERRFLCAVIDAHGRECGEFRITCKAVMKTMRGLYLRLRDICAYHLQQRYYKQDGDPAPITHEAIPEAGSAAEQIAPLLPDWLATTAAGRRQLHRCLFDVLGAQMGSADHGTLLAMMGIAPAAETERHGVPGQTKSVELGSWYHPLHTNDRDDQETGWPDFGNTSVHFHGLISRAMN